MKYIEMNFIDFIQLQRGHDLTKEQIVNGIYPVISSTSIIGYHNMYKAEAPGVIIGRSGTLGKVQYIDVNYWPHNTSLYVKDFKGNDPRFVYYYLQYFGTGSHGGGSAVPTLNRNSLSSLNVNIPNIITQRHITEILINYDNLIENNHKQIKLLEEECQCLYKEWFIDLHFSGYENIKIIDDIPEGWVVSTFENISSLIKETIKPADNITGTPYIGLEHMPRKCICLDQWDDATLVYSNKFRYKENDILFGKIRSYFHKVGYTLTDGVCSTDAMVFRANDNMFGLLLMTAFSEKFIRYTSMTCKEGAKMPRADWNAMRIFPVLIPSNEILIMFNKEIVMRTELMKKLCRQICLLRQVRDNLLPKLMSGEIEV